MGNGERYATSSPSHDFCIMFPLFLSDEATCDNQWNVTLLRTVALLKVHNHTM